MQMKPLAVLALSAAGIIGSTSVQAGFTCIWKDGEPECSSPAGIEDFPIRLRKTRAMFEADGCKVGQILAWSDGAAKWTGSGYPEPLEIAVEYKCTDPEARPKQMSTARYGFTCPRRLFTYYESGFSFDSSMKSTHWDSQGSGTPVPPSDITDTNNRLVKPLYEAWCQ